MYKNKTIDESVFEHEIERAAAILRFPGTRQWWESGGRAQVSEEFSILLDDRLAKESRFGAVWWDKENGFHVAPSSHNDSDAPT